MKRVEPCFRSATKCGDRSQRCGGFRVRVSRAVFCAENVLKPAQGCLSCASCSRWQPQRWGIDPLRLLSKSQEEDVRPARNGGEKRLLRHGHAAPLLEKALPRSRGCSRGMRRGRARRSLKRKTRQGLSTRQCSACLFAKSRFSRREGYDRGLSEHCGHVWRQSRRRDGRADAPKGNTAIARSLKAAARLKPVAQGRQRVWGWLKARA